MNYQTFSNLRFRPLLENSFQIIHKDLRDRGNEIEKMKREIFHLWVSLEFFDVWKSFQWSFSTKNTLKNGCFETFRDSIPWRY